MAIGERGLRRRLVSSKSPIPTRKHPVDVDELAIPNSQRTMIRIAPWAINGPLSQGFSALLNASRTRHKDPSPNIKQIIPRLFFPAATPLKNGLYVHGS